MHILIKAIKHPDRVVQRFYPLIWENWFNPLYTLLFNFIFFPYRQAVRFPLWIYGWPRVYALNGRMECQGMCRPGMVRFNITNYGSPQAALASTELNLRGRIIFRGKCMICTSCRINVGDYGTFDIGANTKIMTQCNITAYSRIVLGAQSRIVHRGQVMDTNFHYIMNMESRTVNAQAFPIIIGDYCWVCNSTTVTGGAVIPNKTIVASNSLVNRDMSSIPEESIIGGVPAKLVKTGFRRVESDNLNRELGHFFHDHPEAKRAFVQTADHGVCDIDQDGCYGSTNIDGKDTSILSHQ